MRAPVQVRQALAEAHFYSGPQVGGDRGPRMQVGNAAFSSAMQLDKNTDDLIFENYGS